MGEMALEGHTINHKHFHSAKWLRQEGTIPSKSAKTCTWPQTLVCAFRGLNPGGWLDMPTAFTAHKQAHLQIEISF
jgi:hypothetical protein